MSCLSWLLIGLIAGWLASVVIKGDGYGIVGDIIVGILGALIGGFLAGLIFGGDYITGFNLGTILVAFLGSVILLAILRLLPGRSTA